MSTEAQNLAQKLEAWIANSRIAQLEAQRHVFHRALTELACWDEGEVVTDRFDQPDAALRARKALAEFFVGPCPHGRDPYDRCDEHDCQSDPPHLVMARRIALDAKGKP